MRQVGRLQTFLCFPDMQMDLRSLQRTISIVVQLQWCTHAFRTSILHNSDQPPAFLQLLDRCGSQRTPHAHPSLDLPVTGHQTGANILKYWMGSEAPTQGVQRCMRGRWAAPRHSGQYRHEETCVCHRCTSAGSCQAGSLHAHSPGLPPGIQRAAPRICAAQQIPAGAVAQPGGPQQHSMGWCVPANPCGTQPIMVISVLAWAPTCCVLVVEGPSSVQGPGASMICC